jgi:protein dithiol oxidoreductase (disulfide-forming)
MRFLRHILVALGISLVATMAGASPEAPKGGVDYRTLTTPQQTDAGDKVEVTEFFWYNCPHCHAFDPALTAWVKKQGDNIVFKRVPIAFRPSFVPQQRLYYTLESMGKTEELHRKIFQAIHTERQPLDTDTQITDFVVKQGIDKQKFIDTFNSFAVQSKTRRATQMQEGYKIDGVPTIAIDGRFITSPSIVGANIPTQAEASLQAPTLQVMDWLVAKAAKEHKGTASEAPKKK